MKKFLVVLAVMALAMAMASVAVAQVTVDGSVEFLMRSVRNTTDWSDDSTTSGDYNWTAERVRLGVNAKHENVKGRIQIENDWDKFGRVEAAQGNATVTATNCADADGNGVIDATECAAATSDAGRLRVREGWLDFNMPFGIPGHIKVGHQFLQLGNGWFFRSNKYGSDAWVVGFPGKNTFAFVNVKAAEGSASLSDDVDAYVLLDTYKIDDKSAVGAYFVNVNDRRGLSALAGYNAGAISASLNTLGLHYNGQLGPVKLAAEIDIQSGEVKSATDTVDLSGNQLVLQATLPMDALTARATLAMGSGDDDGSANEVEMINNLLDKDPHYTIVYEYLMETAAGGTSTGFSNTTALSVGADFKVNKMITVGADLWMLQATEKVTNADGDQTDDLGNEIDVKVNLALYDQLSWNTTIGYFLPGKAYESGGQADNVRAIHSVLSYKF